MYDSSQKGSSSVSLYMKNEFKIANWSEEDKLKLSELYAKTPNKELSLFFNKRPAVITDVANGMGLKKDRSKFIFADLSPLLIENPLSMYWLGFLLADGHFSKINRLKLLLATKDKEHLQKFSDFIKLKTTLKKVEEKAYYLSVMDKEKVGKLKSKYDIASNKTCNPVNFEVFNHLNNDCLVSLFIGMMDGDGHISQRDKSTPILYWKLYPSWLNFMISCINKMDKISNVKLHNPKINNSGYASFICANSKFIYFLKKGAIRLNLPILERKWTFDENRLSKTDISKVNLAKILKCKNKKMSYRGIMEKTGLSYNYIYQALWRNNLI